MAGDLAEALRLLDLSAQAVTRTSALLGRRLHGVEERAEAERLFLSAFQRSCFFESQNAKTLACFYVLNELITAGHAAFAAAALTQSRPFLAHSHLRADIRAALLHLCHLWLRAHSLAPQLLHEVIKVVERRPSLEAVLEKLTLDLTFLTEFVAAEQKHFDLLHQNSEAAMRPSDGAAEAGLQPPGTDECAEASKAYLMKQAQLQDSLHNEVMKSIISLKTISGQAARLSASRSAVPPISQT